MSSNIVYFVFTGIIIMKVLFLVVVIAVCLMTFAPATEARRPPPKVSNMIIYLWS